jgi:hypothetical protein
MPNAPARVYVRDSVEVAEESEVCVIGELRSGSVRAGMQACVSFGSFSVVKTIKRVEFLGGASAGDEISIALDIPEEEERLFWKELCRPDSWIGVIENKENG